MAHWRMKGTDKIMLTVIVKPNSRVEGVEEIDSGTLKVRVNAQPEKGKANERVVELLSKHFKVPKRNISIIKGHTVRKKLIAIEMESSD